MTEFIYSALLVFLSITTFLGFRSTPLYLLSIFFAGVLAGLVIFLPVSKPPVETDHRPKQGILKRSAPLIFLSLVTLLPRIAWISLTHTQPVTDFRLYQRLAEGLAQGEISRQRYIALFPHVLGYPALLSLVYRLFGVNIVYAQLLNLLIFLGIVLIVFWIGVRLFNARWALLAGTLVALWPSQLFYTTVISTEALFTFLLLIGVGIFLQAVSTPQYSSDSTSNLPRSLASFCFLGVVVAAMNAVRPFGLLFLFVAGLYYFISVKFSRVGKLLCFGSLVLVYFLSASLMHYAVERTIQIRAGRSFLGYTLLVGANVDSGGTWNESDAALLAEVYQQGKVHPRQVNQILMERALQRISSAPLQYLNLQLQKNRIMWQDDGYGVYWNRWYQDENATAFFTQKSFDIMTDVSNLYYYGILVLSLLGSLAGIAGGLARRWQGIEPRPAGTYLPDFMSFLAMLILGTIALFLFAEVQPRYHYATLPLLAVLATSGLFYWKNRFPYWRHAFR